MSQLLQSNIQRTISAARIELTSLPLYPELQLYLIAADYPKGPLEYDEMTRILNDPAYWAFCWASGQVLAAYLRDHPERCKDKTVLDLGAGSGVVAIAAAKAGAKRVIACDLDPNALDACRINGELNDVKLELLPDLNDLNVPVDLVIAADVLYDRENLEWLDLLPTIAPEILIADSRVRDRSVFSAYDFIDEVTATTIPDLDEMKEYGIVTIYAKPSLAQG